MMKIKESTVIAACLMLCLLFFSCTFANLTGFYSGYKLLTDEEKERVVRCDRPIEELGNDGNVYVVDTAQMRAYLQRHDSVMVYDWSPGCPADHCISLPLFESLCKSHGVTSCIIKEYFQLDSLPSRDKVASPILFIDKSMYRTDYCNKYTKRFYGQLTGATMKLMMKKQTAVFNLLNKLTASRESSIIRIIAFT